VDGCIRHRVERTSRCRLAYLCAQRRQPAGTEISVDHRHRLGAGQRTSAQDAEFGREIVGRPAGAEPGDVHQRTGGAPREALRCA
jgi:hypothetical protein